MTLLKLGLALNDNETTDSVIDYLTDPQARGDYYSEGGQAVRRWLATDRRAGCSP